MIYLYRKLHWRWLLKIITFMSTRRLKRNKYDPMYPLWSQEEI